MECDLLPDARAIVAGHTTAELIELVRPFVGARLRRDLTASIDIRQWGMASIRADVRAVDTDGVTVHFYGRDELIRWSDITAITVSGLDAAGNRLNSVTYVHAPSNIRKAA